MDTHSFTNGVCECGFNDLEFVLQSTIAMHEHVSNINYVTTSKREDGTSYITYVNGENFLIYDENIESYEQASQLYTESYHNYSWYNEEGKLEKGKCDVCGHDSKLLLNSILENTTENYAPFGEQSYKLKISQIDYVGPPRYEETTSIAEIVYSKNAISTTINGVTEYLEKTNNEYYNYTLNGNARFYF